MIPEYFIIKVRNFSVNIVRRELAIHKNQKPRPTRTTTGTCAKMRNENKRHKVDARRSSVSKKDVKKPSVANASENHTYETCVTGVYTPICSHLL